jgi:hypothetical protein
MFVNHVSYSKWNKDALIFSSAVEFATREKTSKRGLDK